MTIFRRLPLFVIFGLILMTAAAQKPTQKPPEKATSVTGTYSFKGRKGAGCVLEVLQKGDDKIEFNLDCNRGAPSYNMGGSSGEITLKDNVATYSNNESGPCEITFKFQTSGVIVSQPDDKRECGWGYGVTCSGTYKLISRKPPKFETATYLNANLRSFASLL